jgi:hypothetical protein
MTEQSLPSTQEDMPPELDRWNWGAFLLNWIWGIGNNVFIALLTFVPLVGLAMPFVLGAKGNQWAWRNGHWESVEHFRRVQRTWTKWAVIIYGAAIVLIAVLFVSVFSILSHSEAYKLGVAQLEASTEVANLIGAPFTSGTPNGKLSTNGDGSGEASLSFSVSGPKGKGTVDLAATRKNGIWSLTGLKLKMDGQDNVIDLLHPTKAEIERHRWRANFAVSAPLQGSHDDRRQVT